jgi:polyferredoxin
MCKRHAYTFEAQLAGEGAYEGQTMRLDLREREKGARRVAGTGQHFLWWMLWLIWPLIGLVKWGTPLALSAFAAVAESLGTIGAPIVALLLIAAGITLLRRS